MNIFRLLGKGIAAHRENGSITLETVLMRIEIYSGLVPPHLNPHTPPENANVTCTRETHLTLLNATKQSHRAVQASRSSHKHYT